MILRWKRVHRTLPRAAGRAAVFTLALLCSAPAARAASQELPPSSLALKRGGGWHAWWRSEDAPRRWSAPLPEVAEAVRWERIRPGLERGELDLAGDGSAWRLRVTLVRLDPRLLRFELVEALRDAGTRGAWTVDSVPDEAVLALNAGQFRDGRPWGWVVRRGREAQPPGAGPLSMALVVDATGGARLIDVDSIPVVRAGRRVVEAFQSYPMLLHRDGEVPAPLAGTGRGVDVAHRDSRLALGEMRDGRLLVALTRFAGLGDGLGSLPFGPTTPEMAALMGALGCREAMLLDGGLSGQLLLRDPRGRALTWSGWRRVPLGMVVYPAAGATSALHPRARR